MAEHNLNARIIHKHDSEANWNKAVNFKPKKGEIIIYDIDSTHTHQRIKVGDGVNKVAALPFLPSGTITSVKMNGSVVGDSGQVDLGTVITAHQDITGKVDKVSGKALSTNDLTDTLKSNYDAAYTHSQAAHAPSNAQKNVQSDWSATSGDAFIKNKPTKLTDFTNDAGFGTYSKPSGGIPKTDLASAVQTSLGKADTALQSFTETDPTVPSWAKAASKPTYTASEVGAVPATAKGAANGVAELDSAGKVPSSQLPSFVDDVLEYSARSSFPVNGETGKIYVDTATNLTYRWSGTGYVEISPSLALGETSSTAYRGDRGKTAYDHSQAAHAPSNAQKNVQSDWNATSGDAFIKNKPTIPSSPGDVGAAPATHSHDDRYYTESEMDTKLGGKSNTGHKHASQDINAMTGYSKPSSSSAIAATDTLNTAIGKLEKALDSKVNTSDHFQITYDVANEQLVIS